MIFIGEKINGAIPAVGAAIAARDDAEIRRRVRLQAEAGADYIDCAPSTEPQEEYAAMVWLLDIIQSETELPVCLDSPNAALLARILREDLVRRPGMINSVNEEADKCELLFPLVAGTDWRVVGLCCDETGIPAEPERRVAIAERIIAKADTFGVAREKLFIDPCVMALATAPSAMADTEKCIALLRERAPEVKTAAALSNISYNMPARKYVNLGCVAYAVRAGLDAAILDPCSVDLISTVYACEALCMQDKGGRKYNRAWRQGRIGAKK